MISSENRDGIEYSFATREYAPFAWYHGIIARPDMKYKLAEGRLVVAYAVDGFIRSSELGRGFSSTNVARSTEPISERCYDRLIRRESRIRSFMHSLGLSLIRQKYVIYLRHFRQAM